MLSKEKREGVIVFVYYLNKLREGGFIEGGPKITVEGFDTALDLIEGGLQLTRELSVGFCEGLDMDVRIADLVMSAQEIGVPEMLRIMKEKEN
jgi:hypothetical protein